MKNSLVWFRQDLRLLDNPALDHAIRYASSKGGCVFCLYVLDPFWFGSTRADFPRIGIYRRKFLRESLQDLSSRLAKIGGHLSIIRGASVESVASSAADHAVGKVFCQKEFASEERAMEKRLRKRLQNMSVGLMVCEANTLYGTDQLPFSIDELPDVFSKFRRKVEKKCDISMPLPTPKEVPSGGAIRDEVELSGASELTHDEIVEDERAVLSFRGGESEALARLEGYFFQSDSLKSYKETRNGMLGANYSSKFSPWLAMGCISPRTIAHEVFRYEEERHKNDSTYWMIFELLWRDYFAFVVAKHGRSVFQRNGLRGLKLPWKTDETRFEAWREGRTGFPLIDANMRELAATGFMSNRGRQNVASFLTKNLGIDWRLGAEWFESLLLDYDPCSNYGNWNYTAGIGNDPRGFRWFNTLKQADHYDRRGKYVRHWLPELADVVDKFIHTPWEMHTSEQKRCGCIIGVDYPAPVVDLFKSAEHHEQLYNEA